MHVKTEIEIDLGLARVSDSALAMLEGKTGAADLPPDLFSRLLDALGDEHLRRFAARRGAAAVLRVSARAFDADELWHSLRMLGNWLSNTDEAPGDDPDVGPYARSSPACGWECAAHWTRSLTNPST